eukprot:TRINITY_DN55403_c0_g1_i1.p1 TRINITY_DN55403_c0_g1~~TRINITY_DN55403_c0_g1_i1.p1  ORF type:complete len:336 (+),score=59.77 TRINITY_DN55403_c0_g1_i1:50-1057(+)
MADCVMNKTTVEPNTALKMTENPPAARTPNNPVGEIQERMSLKLGRPMTKDDIIYTFRDCKLDAPPGVSRFIATVTITTLDGCPSRDGVPCTSKRSGKRAAAMAVLNDPSLQALLPQLRALSIAEHANSNERSSNTGATRGGSVEEHHIFRSRVPELFEKLQKFSRTPNLNKSITFTIVHVGNQTFSASVTIRTSSGDAVFSGCHCRGKKAAKSSAAEAALNDPALQSLLQNAASGKDGDEACRFDNPVGKLQETLSAALRLSRPSEIVYTFSDMDLEGAQGFIAEARVTTVKGVFSCSGRVFSCKRAAKRSAAEVMLADLEMRGVLKIDTIKKD